MELLSTCTQPSHAIDVTVFALHFLQFQTPYHSFLNYQIRLDPQLFVLVHWNTSNTTKQVGNCLNEMKDQIDINYTFNIVNWEVTSRSVIFQFVLLRIETSTRASWRRRKPFGLFAHHTSRLNISAKINSKRAWKCWYLHLICAHD